LNNQSIKYKYLGVAIFAIAFIVRLILAYKSLHPGHGDNAFYFTLAQNIANGRGFIIDYIWQYLTIPDNISHNAIEFWMPLSSVIMAAAMALAGKSLFVALIPGILSGMLIPVIVYFWSRNFSDSRFVQIGSAGLTLFLPTLVAFSIITDSTVYYVLFVSVALLFMAKAQQKPVFYLCSAAFIGLAHLTRQDSILLLPVLLLMIFFGSHRTTAKLRWFFLALIVYVAVFSPVWISNIKQFGAPLSPGPSKAMFVTNHEDLYSYGKDLNWHSYLRWGINNMIGSRAKATADNIKILYDSASGPILILALTGLIGLCYSGEWRNRWRLYLPPILYALVLIFFYSIIVPFNAEGGAFHRSVLSICPFLIVVAVDFLYRQIGSRKMAVVLIWLIGFYLFGYSTMLSINLVKKHNLLNTQMNELKVILKQHTVEGRETVIMTRNPWEVHFSTGFKTLQIPNNDPDTIYMVARRYGANFLILPGQRPGLDCLLDGSCSDSRFAKLVVIPGTDLTLFRIL
jgi:4-amino-4-deoxy-L-arabinose transferase-like glycosyltransferase